MNIKDLLNFIKGKTIKAKYNFGIYEILASSFDNFISIGEFLMSYYKEKSIKVFSQDEPKSLRKGQLFIYKENNKEIFIHLTICYITYLNSVRKKQCIENFHEKYTEPLNCPDTKD